MATKQHELWGCGPISMFRVLLVQSERCFTQDPFPNRSTAINFCTFYVVSLFEYVLMATHEQHARHAGLILLDLPMYTICTHISLTRVCLSRNRYVFVVVVVVAIVVIVVIIVAPPSSMPTPYIHHLWNS